MLILVTLGTLVTILSAHAQVEGLWVVKAVTVGNQDKTPVAKWFRFSAGKYTSGNGWQQHTVGSYHYEKNSSALLLRADNEPSDPFGEFVVASTGNTMTWTRQEEGEVVSVTLEAAKEIPPSITDQVKGLWDLVLAMRLNKVITLEIDPHGSQYLFIRWDRVFVKSISQKQQIRGYWFMNGHKPELKFINESSNQQSETWNVAFDKGRNMVLTGASESVKGITLMYARKIQFPD